MRVSCAVLCDAATVRENLLHVLGAGITRLNRQAFPSSMGCTLALQIVVHPTETDREHDGRVVVQDEDGAVIAEVGLGFGLGGDLLPGEEHLVPIVVQLDPVTLPAPGGYSVEILLDGNHHVSIPIRGVLVVPD
jgi:hypothetical protein